MNKLKSPVPTSIPVAVKTFKKIRKKKKKGTTGSSGGTALHVKKPSISTTQSSAPSDTNNMSFAHKPTKKSVTRAYKKAFNKTDMAKHFKYGKH
jgi:hypothetical protein